MSSDCREAKMADFLIAQLLTSTHHDVAASGWLLRRAELQPGATRLHSCDPAAQQVCEAQLQLDVVPSFLHCPRQRVLQLAFRYKLCCRRRCNRN